MKRLPDTLVMAGLLVVVGCVHNAGVVKEIQPHTGTLTAQYETYRDRETDRPIKHGYFRSYFEDGTYKKVGQYRDGRRVGEWRDMYRNGQTRKAGNYRDGEEHGKWVAYRKDGRVRWERTYEDGKKSGRWVYYFESGRIRREENYGQDRMNGRFISYYENGISEQVGTYRDGRQDGRWVRYDETGRLWSEENYVDGNRDGKWVWHVDGNIVAQGTYADGEVWNGMFVDRYQNGRVRHAESYRDGRRDGKWVSYYENGEVEQERNFQDGKLHGTWAGWYPNGQMSYAGNYRGDKKDGRWVDWFENGQVSYAGSYQDDRKDGKWISHFEDGRIHSEGTFEEGRLSGRSVSHSAARRPAGDDMTVIGDAGFRLDSWEVTNRLVAAFLNQVGNLRIRGAALVEMNSAHVLIQKVDGLFRAKEGFADHPAVEVSFEGARACCEWAGKRLPTEAEWQSACEGPEKLAYPWGNHFRVSGPEAGKLANIVGDADGFVKTAPVGSFPEGRSPYGVWDMGGNVWEWTSGPAGKPMLRGGSWGNADAHARCARSDDPSSSHSYFKGSSVGFRCAESAR